jgi:phage shock protein A
MSESIGKRVARLMSASVNALVDAVENSSPETVMEQALREIDTAIEEARTELGQQLAQKHLTEKKLAEEKKRYADLTSQIEVAVANGRDDLAERGIAEQMDIEAKIPVLESSLAEAGIRKTELEGFIQALQAKKREMRTELQTFIRNRSPQQSTGSRSIQSIERQVDRADTAFNRILAQHSEGRSPGTASQLLELEELSRKNRIAERLAAFKAEKD